MRGIPQSFILNNIEFLHIDDFLPNNQSNNLTLVLNKLKISLMVANSTAVQTIAFEPTYREN